ncbi:hypothetical protein N2152v2_010264 [Parachlorella kessleri]
MATSLERLRALLTVTQQLSDSSPEVASANAQRSYNLAGLAPVPFDANDSEVARLAAEVADKLSAWAPAGLQLQSQANSSAPTGPELAVALVQALAAVGVVDVLLVKLLNQLAGDLNSTGSSTLYRIFTSCCRVLLGHGAAMLQLAQHTLRSTQQPSQLATDLVLNLTSTVLTGCASLLTHVFLPSRECNTARQAQAALAIASRPAEVLGLWRYVLLGLLGGWTLTPHAWEQSSRIVIIKLLNWVLGGPVVPAAGAFQRYLAEAAGLFTFAMEDLLPLVAREHRRQVLKVVRSEESDTTHDVFCITSELLRQPALLVASMAAIPDPGVAPPAAAAIPPLLRSYLAGEPPGKGLKQLQEAISAAACHSYTEMVRTIGGGEGDAVPDVCWECTALSCAALQAVLQREVWSRAGAGAKQPAENGARAGLVETMEQVGGWLRRLAMHLQRSWHDAVARPDAAVAATAVEAVVRLCGRLWQGAGQARAALGDTAVHSLGNMAADVVHTAPQAVVAALCARPEQLRSGMHSLADMTASLAKLMLLDSLRQQGGFQDRQLPRATQQLEDCAGALLDAVGQDDPGEATAT